MPASICVNLVSALCGGADFELIWLESVLQDLKYDLERRARVSGAFRSEVSKLRLILQVNGKGSWEYLRSSRVKSRYVSKYGPISLVSYHIRLETKNLNKLSRDHT